MSFLNITGGILDIVYEDMEIIAVNKAPGISSQPDRDGSGSLLEYTAKYLGKSESSIYIINRLDKPVSGIVLFAKDGKSAAALSKQVSERGIKKRYYAVVQGKTPDSGRLEDYMIKIERLNISKIADKGNKNAKKAILSYKLLGNICENEPLSLLDIDLETGRHHQIRLQLSHMGNPIWGDRKYNPAGKYSQEVLVSPKSTGDIALFAYGLEFKQPKTGKMVAIKLPLPKAEPFSQFSIE